MVLISCDNQHLNEDREFQLLNGLWVLVVDDNADNLELVRLILEEYGMRVLTAASASEALNAIAKFFPDILISDIAMPGEDGYELMGKIRTLASSQEKFLPALALTACVGDEARSLALESGFQIYVPKPVEISELVAAVAQLATLSTGISRTC